LENAVAPNRAEVRRVRWEAYSGRERTDHGWQAGQLAREVEPRASEAMAFPGFVSIVRLPAGAAVELSPDAELRALDPLSRPLVALPGALAEA
jgi:hypothetical protein